MRIRYSKAQTVLVYSAGAKNIKNTEQPAHSVNPIHIPHDGIIRMCLVYAASSIYFRYQAKSNGLIIQAENILIAHHISSSFPIDSITVRCRVVNLHVHDNHAWYQFSNQTIHYSLRCEIFRYAITNIYAIYISH
jgi:hypothetical protein